MQNKLLDLLKYLTRRMILESSFLDFCLVNKIDPEKFPDSHEKNVALEYMKLRNAENHAIAAVQVSGHLSELDGPDDLPDDGPTLGAYYHVVVRDYEAKNLANRILAKPDDVEKLISEFQIGKSEDSIVRFGAVLEDVVHESIRLTESGQSMRVLPGWPTLSENVGGFNPGRVGMLLAATGFGKTTLAQNLAMASAKKFSTVYFNMEMILQDFAEKLIMSGAKIDFKTYKRDIGKQEVQQKIGKFYADVMEEKLFFSRGSALSPQEIFAICRRQKLLHGLDFVIVDYDQKLLLNTNKHIPEWKALQIAIEQFEVLAKELSCYILILAQEGEEGEVSGSRRSKFPASTVMRFYQDDEAYLIECVKNRFGKRGLKIEVEYVSEKGFVSERGEHQPTPKESKAFSSSKKNPSGNERRMGEGGSDRERKTSRYGSYD
jgi:hypothetical protein